MEKLDVRIKKTYAQLIAGFLELLSNKTFDDITVSEICDHSDVHRATFYKHFRDKYEFLTFCLKTLLSDINLTPITPDITPENVKKSCTEFIREVFGYINKYHRIFSTVFSSNQSASFNYHLEAMITSFCFDKFRTVLNNIPEHKIELLANFYSGAVLGVIKWFVKQNKECALDDIYTFFEHRIDEISLYYRNHLMDNG